MQACALPGRASGHGPFCLESCKHSTSFELEASVLIITMIEAHSQPSAVPGCILQHLLKGQSTKVGSWTLSAQFWESQVCCCTILPGSKFHSLSFIRPFTHANPRSQAPAVGWSTPYEIAILILSIAIFVGFLLWERKYAAEPIMPLDIFRAPTFLSMIFVVLFAYMGFGIALWYSIAWQQTLRSLSVLDIGISLIPFGLGSTAAVGLAVLLLPRIAAKWVMAIGVGVIVGASLLLATMPMQQSYWLQVFPAMLLCGCCPDFVYLAAQVIASSSVSTKHLGVASSLVGTLNLYGISLGLGFAGTIEVAQGKNSWPAGSEDSPEAVMAGFKAALYFSAALAAVGLLLDMAFVSVPKVKHGE